MDSTADLSRNFFQEKTFLFYGAAFIFLALRQKTRYEIRQTIQY